MYDAIMTAADASDAVGSQGKIFHHVWQAAAALRSRGKLVALGKHIQYPVVAIRGDGHTIKAALL